MTVSLHNASFFASFSNLCLLCCLLLFSTLNARETRVNRRE